MTVVRTDLIPNLFANAISSISKASPAVVTVPVIARVVSTTGTIGTVTGSGTTSAPWTAAITLMTTTAGLRTGDIITATAGSGTFAAGGEVSIGSITGNQSIVIRKIGGTIPTAGTVTNISLPAVGTLPANLVDGRTVLFTNPQNTITIDPTAGTSTGVFVEGEIITQATSGATGVVTNVMNTVVTISGQKVSRPTFIEYNVTSGVFNTTNLVTGSRSEATAVPTVVTGMNQLLTAGVNNTNSFYVDVLTANTFALYKNEELSTPVDSSAFTTATPNAGQYTTIDPVEITEAP